MILSHLLALLAPYDCLGCGTEGRLLCPACASSLRSVPERCYHCRARSDAGITCRACRQMAPLASVRARTKYAGPAKRLVLRLKFSGARDAADEIADQLVRLLPQGDNLVIVPVITATTRARQRGYDQAQLIAKALARRTGVPYVAALRRSGQHHQVGSNREQRRTQLQGAYRCVKSSQIRNAHIVLIDDVLTTGATLEAAARPLLQAGAHQVSGLVFAQA